jgi:capsid protein
MDTVELERNMLLTLPGGWNMKQVKPEQPATTYVEFVREKLGEAARCLNMPRNIALCDSSAYNYASGRLDHQTYFKSIRVEQAHLEDVVLDRILDAWMREAVHVPGLLSHSPAALDDYPHQWFWDGMEHVDPAKEASAQAQRLASNTTTLASEFAKEGKDWETELRQRAKEVALMKELGLTIEPTKPMSEPAPADEEDGNGGNNRSAA